VKIRSTDPSATGKSRKPQCLILMRARSLASGPPLSASRALRLASLCRTRRLAGRGGPSSPNRFSRALARRASDAEHAKVVGFAAGYCLPSEPLQKSSEFVINTFLLINVEKHGLATECHQSSNHFVKLL
jgi:hypothetical protein